MTPAKESFLQAADGTPLFIADWPRATTRGGIVLMHGLGEHCGRYVHVARFFNECGYAVRAYDHRGHGRSGGTRGDVPGREAILGDAKIVIADFARSFDSPPLLLGHSMGGLFAADYATGNVSPLSGLILSSPALRIKLPRKRELMLKAMLALAPGLGLPNGLKVDYLSHDPAVIDAYRNDPLVHSRISARLLKSLLEAVGFAQARAAPLTVRTLLIVAGDDHLVDASGSEEWFRKLAPGIGTLHVYPDLYHELFNETGSQRVFDDVRAWLRDC